MSKIIEKFEKFNEIKIFVFRWKGIPRTVFIKVVLIEKNLTLFTIV